MNKTGETEAALRARNLPGITGAIREDLGTIRIPFPLAHASKKRKKRSRRHHQPVTYVTGLYDTSSAKDCVFSRLHSLPDFSVRETMVPRSFCFGTFTSFSDVKI